VIETTHSTAEARLALPGTPHGRSKEVVLFAQAEDTNETGSARGLSWSVDGDQFAVVEGTMTDHRWRLVRHLPVED
jgi:hypothetical protein